MSERDGVRLGACFAYITNYLGFCGPAGKSDLLLNYIIGENRNTRQVKDYLVSFEGLLPYFSSIASKNQSSPFDYKVVEAYWIGNTLLNKFRKRDMIELLLKLEKRGLPASVTQNLISGLPEGMIPHHSFNVLYVGVGKMTMSVKTTLQNMDRCRISYGLVRDVKPKSLVVKYRPLRIENKKITFGQYRRKSVRYEKRFLPGLGTNSLVAVHWNFAAMLLNEKQKENLEYYTERNINAVNSVGNV